MLDSERAVHPSLVLMTAGLHSGTLLGEDHGSPSWKLCPCQIRGAITIMQLMNESPCQPWVHYNQNSGVGFSGCWGINDCWEAALKGHQISCLSSGHWSFRWFIKQLYLSVDTDLEDLLAQLTFHIWMSSIMSHQRSRLENSRNQEAQSILRQLLLFEKPLFIFLQQIFTKWQLSVQAVF